MLVKKNRQIIFSTISTFIFVAMAISLISSNVAAQTPKPNYAKTRSLFVTGEADALKVVVYGKKKKDKEFKPVKADETFKQGDKVRFEITSNFDGYVYVFNSTPGGKKHLIFPLQANNRVKADRSYTIPNGNSYEFDNEKGIEVIQVMFSRTPISQSDFDDSGEVSMNDENGNRENRENEEQPANNVNSLQSSLDKGTKTLNDVQTGFVTRKRLTNPLNNKPLYRGIILSTNSNDKSKKEDKKKVTVNDSAETFVVVNDTNNSSVNNQRDLNDNLDNDRDNQYSGDDSQNGQDINGLKHQSSQPANNQRLRNGEVASFEIRLRHK